MVNSKEWVCVASIGDLAYHFIMLTYCLNFRSRKFLVIKIEEKRADMKNKINKIMSLVMPGQHLSQKLNALQ